MIRSTGDMARIEALKGILLRGFKRAGTKSAYFSFKEMAENPALKEPSSVERILTELQEESGFTITFDTREKTIRGDTKTDDLTPVRRAQVSTGVEIHASHPATFAKELERICAKIARKKMFGKTIESIEIIPREEESKADVVVNEERLDRAIDLKGKLWSVLIEVIENGSAQSNEAKSVADYFNKNKKCPLYKNGHQLTEILINDGGTLRKARGVRIEMRSQQTLGRREKKSLKNA